MKTRTSLFFVAALELLALCGSAWAVEVLKPGYSVETYVTYSGAGIGSALHMTFDSDGNLYVTHKGTSRDVRDGCIHQIETDRQVRMLAEGFYYPRDLVWTGGSAYGDYLYVADTGRAPGGEIDRVDLNGNVSFFSRPDNQPGCVALDITGNYGGYLYSGTLGLDHIDLLNLAGGISRFSDFPHNISGGPYDMAFDPGVAYGGLMYVATINCTGTQYSGIFSLDTNGTATRFTGDLVAATHIAFDEAGDFGEDMFVVGKSGFNEPWGIWRVGPDGTATEFARTISGIGGLAFGPDGAMYVAEYDADNELVIISRISLATPREVAINRIKHAIDEKVEALERIDVALEEEWAAYQALEELLESGDYGDLSRWDIVKAKLKVRFAIWRQKLCKAGLQKSISKLEDSLILLGCEVQPQSWPEPQEQADMALIRADINEDGGVDFLDFAILMEHWLKSYEAE